MGENKQQALKQIDAQAEYYCAISDDIFDHPETSFEEVFAAERLCKALEENGFAVKNGLAEIPTAFSGSFGSGRPVIGILGEYDALSALSQAPDTFRQEPLVPGGNGHGCGHNLLGAGALAAAVAVKEYLKQTGKPGTVIYYGCPGEEGGSGKAFMARAGVFNGLDCALTWHPSTINITPPSSSLANFQVAYRFKGVSSHAASSPHLGRSALDGVELMNTGVQYLREHIWSDARIHYAITNTGGTSPNVVQAEAEVVYLIRAPKISQVKDLYRRVNLVAEGAAMMTETSVEIDFGKACYNLLPNDTLANALQQNMEAIGAPAFTADEKNYAACLNADLPPEGRMLHTLGALLGEKGRPFVETHRDKELCDCILPYLPIRHTLASSTDVGDVSWVCPTHQIATTTMAAATPAHSWQLTAQGKSSHAHKGMLFAGKAIAGAAIDLLENPGLVEQARQEFERRLDGERYEPVIPAHVTPCSCE